MQRTKNIIVVFSFLLFLAGLPGCEKHFDNIDEYEKFVKGSDSPLKQQVVKDDIVFNLRYYPTDAVLIPEYRRYLSEKNILKNNKNISELEKKHRLTQLTDELKKRKKSIDNYLVFILSVQNTKTGRSIEFANFNKIYYDGKTWIERLLFGMREFIFLKTANGKEIPLSLYNMERNYGLTNELKFMIYFPRYYEKKDLLNNKELSLFMIREFGLSTGEVDLPCDQVRDYKYTFIPTNIK